MTAENKLPRGRTPRDWWLHARQGYISLFLLRDGNGKQLAYGQAPVIRQVLRVLLKDGFTPSKDFSVTLVRRGDAHLETDVTKAAVASVQDEALTYE